MTNESEALFREGASTLGLACTDQQLHAFGIYLSELLKWNRVHNLTSRATERDIVIMHFLDSLLYLKALPVGATRIADVGSGAGFPGLPMKIMAPDATVLLIEPSLKKAEFLRHVCRKLQLRGIEVYATRLEGLTGVTVDVAVTRALFSVQEFIEKTRALVASGGLLVLSKGPKLEGELKNTAGADITVQSYALPFTGMTRRLVVVKT